MNTDLKLSPAAFGFAAGVFFLGYFLFQVPSNLMMAKVGPRRWLGPLMLAWGVIAMSTAFVHTRTGLSIVRFLLGVAEAGFFPGLTLYITFWFRSRDHAKAIAWVLTGSYIAGFVGGPLSGWLLGWSHWGLRGWQWLFVIEGLLPVIFAFVILAFWTDRPQDAKWLRPEQREWIIREIAAEKATKDTPQKIGIRQALTRPGTLLLMFVFFVHSIGNLGVVFWMPQMLKSVGKTLTPMGVGLLTMLPNITFVFALLLCSWHSDKTGERHWHVVGAMLIGSLGLYLFPFTTMLPLAVLAICVAVFGMGGAHANFWASCIELLGPKEAAAGLALISSGSALGGFTGP
jgi:ACS family tartrate transporter-like MFS transporter